MLKKIRIENLALVESVNIEFDKGLIVLTGETGAGKSIIVNALSLALGGRAEREYIRNGADQCVIEADFDVSRMPAGYRKEFAGFISKGLLRISREIAGDGRSRIKINDSSTTLGQLKSVTSPIAEILGQHAAQMLMNEDNHLEFLDHFAALAEKREIVANTYSDWKQTATKLSEITAKRDQIAKEKELLLFQRNEIEKAQLSVGEEERLLGERKLLDSARALMASAEMIRDIIDSEENSVSSLLNLAHKELDKMARIDTQFEKKVSELIDVTYRLEDLRSFIEQYGSSIADDPNRIEEINLRLDEIYNLKKKYGGSEQSVLDSLAIIKRNLSETPADIDDYIDDLGSKSRALFEQYTKHALALSDARKKAARHLQKLVTRELEDLAIENGGFEFEFVYEDDPEGVIMDGRAVRPAPDGLERGRIMFSANPGEPLRSLVKTASGGEISRVLLALKSAEKKNNKLLHSLLVFDEVDSGIGGRTAVRVGKKLARLSADSQLIVITHLHQIAREGTHHFLAEKKIGSDKRAVINVRKLDSLGIQKELARMIALPE